MDILSQNTETKSQDIGKQSLLFKSSKEHLTV